MVIMGQYVILHSYSLMNLHIIYNGHIWHSSSHGQENEIAISINRNTAVIQSYILYRGAFSLPFT